MGLSLLPKGGGSIGNRTGRVLSYYGYIFLLFSVLQFRAVSILFGEHRLIYTSRKLFSVKR